MGKVDRKIVVLKYSKSVWPQAPMHMLVTKQGNVMMNTRHKKTFDSQVKQLTKMGILKKSGSNYILKVPK